jgi:hypothetical protein
LNQRDLFLLDSARVFLAPGVAVTRTGLKDSRSGDACTLSALGRHIVPQLETGVTIKALIRSIRRTYDIEERTVRADLQQFFTVLSSAQLLSIQQSYLGELGARIRRRASSLLRRPARALQAGRRSPYRRYPATPAGILKGSLKAHQPTMAVGVVLAGAIQPLVFLPLIRRGELPSLRMAFFAVQPLMVYVGLLVASVILHEFIHYWVARQLAVRLKSVYVGPGVVGITQLDDGSGRNGIVSAAGPIGTVLVLIWLALLVPQLHLGYPFTGIAAPVLCLAVAVIHLFGLTPLTSDGKQFWKLLGFAETRPGKVA